LLDRLDDAGIKAIFFLVASRIALNTPIEREQALLAREIVRRGHRVGGHTIDHVQLPLLSDDAVKEQLRGSEEIFTRALGGRPWIYRPPFGAHSQRIDQLAAARGYTTVLWNLGGEDFQVQTAQEVYRAWQKSFDHGRRGDDGRGGIILLHDIHPWSVDAFQMIVAHLLARNCELLDRHEELFDFVDDLRFFYVPRGSARADAEAPPADPYPAWLEQRQAQLRERTARRCKSMARAF
jgi:peptidoglycan/xylan/chitin deacetylase (PgdA/CDA1 family)